MPYKDPAKQQEASRLWAARRRTEWLAGHPCACGQAAVGVVAGIGAGAVAKGVFGWKPERRDAAIEAVKARPVCQDHRDEWSGQIRAELSARMTKTPAPVAPAAAADPTPPAPRQPPAARAKAARPRQESGIMTPAFDRAARREWREERRRRLGYG